MIVCILLNIMLVHFIMMKLYYIYYTLIKKVINYYGTREVVKNILHYDIKKFKYEIVKDNNLPNIIFLISINIIILNIFKTFTKFLCQTETSFFF